MTLEHPEHLLERYVAGPYADRTFEGCVLYDRPTRMYYWYRSDDSLISSLRLDEDYVETLINKGIWVPEWEQLKVLEGL